MTLADHTQYVRDATGIYDQKVLPTKTIWALLNKGWKKISRELLAHDFCIHDPIVANTAMYTPSGMQTTVLRLKKVTVNGVTMRYKPEFKGLKDTMRQTDETGFPKFFIWERRSPYGFSITLAPTPDTAYADTSTESGLWIWGWDELPNVFSESETPELDDAEQVVGRDWAIRSALVRLNDDRYRIFDADYRQGYEHLKSIRSGPISVPVPFYRP